MSVTWNPSDKSSNVTLSGGNLVAGFTTASDGGVRATLGFKAGKHYFEVVRTTEGTGGDEGVGAVTSTANLDTFGGSAFFSSLAFHTGALWTNGGTTGISLGTFSSGDVANIAVDLDHGKIWFAKNGGNWNNNGSANPATNTSGVDMTGYFTSGTTIIFPTVCSNNTTQVYTGRFIKSSFSLAIPSGFAPWGIGTRARASASG